jgi:hypothetical protein
LRTNLIKCGFLKKETINKDSFKGLVFRGPSFKGKFNKILDGDKKLR